MSAQDFAEILRRRVEEEMRETGITKKQLSRRFGASESAVEVWIRGGRPMPKYHHMLARFVRVPFSQMETWFPEEERRRIYASRRKT